HPIYQILREGGVKLKLYNGPGEAGLTEVMEVLKAVDCMSAIKTAEDLKNPAKVFATLSQAAHLARSRLNHQFNESQQRKLFRGLAQMLGKAQDAVEDFVDEIIAATSDNILSMSEMV
ncbi:MAG: hypothetical protein CUN55_20560, partial [Phototrophicales bacterium]